MNGRERKMGPLGQMGQLGPATNETVAEVSGRRGLSCRSDPWPRVKQGETLRIRLEDACLLIADCPHTTAPDEGRGYPLVRTPNVGLGRLVFNNMHRVSEQVYKERNKRATPQAGDLIYAREATPGNVALIMPGQEVCLGQRTVLLRPNPAIVDSAYLTYLLLSKECRNKLLGTATGVTVAHVNIPAIRSLELALPPLPLQRRIADILSAYDDLIENNRRRIAILEETARTLYRKMFVAGAKPGWKAVKLTDLADRIASGGTPKSSVKKYYEGDIKWYSTKELKDSYLIDSIKHISKDALENSAAKMFPPGTLLMAIYAAPTVGRLGILEEEACFNQAAVGIVPKKNVGLCFMYELLLDERDKLNQLSKGVAQQNLSVGVVKEYEVVMPDENTLNTFNGLAQPMFEQMSNLSRQNAKLAAARDLLLPRLMSGRLRVDAAVGRGKREVA